MKLIRVDWSELADAFQDDSREHRYYLDRDTGEVHFFSTYLENEEEHEDEQRITAEDRYVTIPLSRRSVSSRDLQQFVRTLDDGQDRKLLSSTLKEQEARARFNDTLNGLPETRKKWSRFQEEIVDRRIREWLGEVGVQPLNE
jgi:hypothetical protein